VPSRGELIHAWLRYNADEDPDVRETDPDWWAVLAVQDMVLSDPDEAWNLITDLARAADTEWQIVMVGCGPMEDLLYTNPDRYMRALDEAASQNPKLVNAAACTALDGEPAGTSIEALLRRYNQPRM
jgi:hypothetical protein